MPFGVGYLFPGGKTFSESAAVEEEKDLGPATAEATVFSEFAVKGLEIENAVLLGPISRDWDGDARRTFPREWMAQHGASYGGGVRVYDNHDAEAIAGRKVRDTADLVGEVVRSWYDPATNRIRGDIRLFDTEKGRRLATLAREAPHLIGCSPVHDISVDRSTRVVQGLKRVRSVDLVTEPATTRSLRESATKNEPERRTMDPITLERVRAEAPAIFQAILAEGAAAYESSEKARALEARTKDLEAKAADLEKALAESKVAKAALESRAVVEEVLAKATLPKASLDRLRVACEGRVVEREELEKAVAAEATYLRSLGVALNGKASPVVGNGGRPDHTGTESESALAADAIARRVFFNDTKPRRETKAEASSRKES